MNPYAPGSGRRPHELAGRGAEIDAFDLIVAKTRHGAVERPMVLHGLRGVGKTVLLNEFRRQAERADFPVVTLEGRSVGGESVKGRLARDLLVAGRKLGRGRPRARLSRALGSISSFSAKLGVTGIDLGVGVEPGRADSGSLEVDLEELVEDLAVALREESRGVVFLIDEMQDLDAELLEALLATQHLAQQREWPFYVIGAGLPSLPSILSASRSYAERLFTYRTIGALGEQDAAAALTRPAERLGAEYDDDARGLLLDASGGYPYFIQEFGKAAWDVATGKVINAADAIAALVVGRGQLDHGFYISRWERATAAERRYLELMATDGDTGSSTTEIARRASKSVGGLSPIRASLIAKGVIFAPEHGRVTFTVPGMADYIQRTT